MNEAGHWIRVWVSSPDTHGELRFGSDISISALKMKLESSTGIPSRSQVLRLQRTTSANFAGHGGAGEGPGEQEVLAVLDEEERTLASYGVRDFMTIRVDSNDPGAKAVAGQFTDVSRVEKFELTDKEYESRSDTVRTFKQRNQLGRFAPPPPASPVPEGLPLPSDWIVGARCIVAFSSELSRRGSIQFIGPTQFGAKDDSIWIGVELDEPTGKGDGSVDGVRYFQAGPLRATFVRRDKVTVGDYPELDPFADEEEEMEM